MREQLTKEFLRGIQHEEEVVLEHPHSDATARVVVRPLTSAEVGKVERIANRNNVMHMNPDNKVKEIRVPLGEQSADLAEARQQAISMAIVSDEKWSPDDVAEWPGKWVSKVARRIGEISDCQALAGKSDEAVRRFREEAEDDTASGKE